MNDIKVEANSPFGSINSNSIVYVLAREDKADIVKVGSTRVSAKSRANNYTDGGWHVVNELEVPTMLQFYVEHYAHDFLKKRGKWLPPGITSGTASEIFTCSSELAIEAVETAFNYIFDQAQRLLVMDIDKEGPEHQKLLGTQQKHKESIKNQQIRIEDLTSRVRAQEKIIADIKKTMDFYDPNINKGKKDLIRFSEELAAVYKRYEFDKFR